MASHNIYKAVVTASDGTTVPHPVFNATPFITVTVSADNLAGVEEIDIYRLSGTTWVVAKDDNGVALKLAATAGTSNALQFDLSGGTWYQFRKDTTASACGIWVDEGPAVNT